MIRYACMTTLVPSLNLDLSCRPLGAGIVDDSPADHRHDRLDVLDLIGRDREVVAIEHHQVGELARLDRSQVVLLEHEVRILAGVRDQRVLAADRLRSRRTLVPPTILPVTAHHSVVNGRI